MRALHLQGCSLGPGAELRCSYQLTIRVGRVCGSDLSRACGCLILSCRLRWESAKKEKAPYAQEPSFQERIAPVLVEAAGDVREHVVRVGTDELDGSDHDHQNNGQHHRVLSDVLAFIIGPHSA